MISLFKKSVITNIFIISTKINAHEINMFMQQTGRDEAGLNISGSSGNYKLCFVREG